MSFFLFPVDQCEIAERAGTRHRLLGEKIPTVRGFGHDHGPFVNGFFQIFDEILEIILVRSRWLEIEGKSSNDERIKLN